MCKSKERVKREVKKEYHQFKRNLIKRKKGEIFESCGKIFFYANIYEYFLYNPSISEDTLRRFSYRRLSIERLWDLYLKNEYTNVVTWNGIDELLEIACG